MISSRHTTRWVLRCLALTLLAPLAFAQVAGDSNAIGGCLTCHQASADEPVHAIFGTAHGSLAGGGDAGCQACHGNSTAHAATPVNESPDLSFGPRWPAPADQRSAACLGCHEENQQLLWLGSVHEQEDMACDSCHNSHAQVDPMQVARHQPQACGECHSRTLAELNLPSRHPINEGKTACSDCHNAHGSMTDGALAHPTLNQSCNSCHQEKRGPFLWEHPPSAEDCSLCHRPHGSVNDRLLTARGPALCQQCHAAAFHPSVPYGNQSLGDRRGGQNIAGKNCLNCHSQVHGSNHPSGARLTR